MRWIPEQVRRAQLRSTLTYRVVPRLSLGVEYNPRVDEVGPLANLVALTEGKRRPAVIFGTSSDRIGTPDGQAYFVTASKDLESVNGWPLAPYVGLAYGTFENELEAVAGFRARLPRNFAIGTIWDGHNLHPTVEYRYRRHAVTLLWVDTEDFGLSYSVAF